MIIYLKPYATYNKKKSTSLSHDNKVDKYISHNKTDFVQWIVIVTSKSMHLVFYAKKVGIRFSYNNISLSLIGSLLMHDDCGYLK